MASHRASRITGSSVAQPSAGSRAAGEAVLAPRPRVVLFTPSYSEPGGVAQRSRLLASGLARSGCRVTVIARATARRTFGTVRAPDLRVIEVPGFGLDRLASLAFLGCGIPLGLVLGGRAPALLAIKLHSSSMAAAACSVILRRPYVSLATSSGRGGELDYLLGQALPGDGSRQRRAHRLGLGIRRMMLRRAAFIVAQTPAAAAELRQLVGQDRLAVIPTPVESVQAPPLSGNPSAVFTGRLSKEKDLFVLLAAWRSVVQEQPAATLTIVGDGGPHEPVEAELRRVVAEDASLTATVRFTGRVIDVGPHLSAADVFVLPSRSEGMSNALLEACARGRVVVASDIPANRAVLGEAYPLLFRTGDSRALTGSLLAGLTDEGLRSQSLAEVRRRLPEFSLTKVIERLLDLLEQAESSPAAGQLSWRRPSVPVRRAHWSQTGSAGGSGPRRAPQAQT